MDFAIHYGVTFASHRREAEEECTLSSQNTRANKKLMKAYSSAMISAGVKQEADTAPVSFTLTTAASATTTTSSMALKSSRHAFRAVFTAISMAALTTFFVGEG